MMDKDSTLEVLDALAMGIDPVTGEVFSEGSSLQNPEITRALFTAIALIKGEKTVKKVAERQGLPWEYGEDDKLKQAFNSGAKIADIAKEHQRSAGAIKSRLQKIGLVE